MTDPPKSDKPLATGEDLQDQIDRVLVAGFRLVGFELGRLPDQVSKALASKSVRDALEGYAKKELAGLQKKQAAAGGASLSGKEAQEALDRLWDAAGEPTKDELEKLVKAAPAYKRFDAELKELKRVWERTPAGVFIDENATVLLIVGSVAAVGGLGLLYVAKTGDPVLKLLEKKKVTFVDSGAIEYKAGFSTLKPSERAIGIDQALNLKFKRVTAKFSLDATISEKSKAASVDFSGEVEIKPDETVSLKAKVKAKSGDIALGSGPQGPAGLASAKDPKVWSVAADLSAKVKIKGTGAVDATVGATVTAKDLGVRAGVGYSGTIKGLDTRLGVDFFHYRGSLDKVGPGPAGLFDTPGLSPAPLGTGGMITLTITLPEPGRKKK